MVGKKEGHPLKESSEMKSWKKEFDKMTLKEHDDKLARLGLDKEDIEEFNEDFKELKKSKKTTD